MKMLFEPSDIKPGLKVRCNAGTLNVGTLYVVLATNFLDSRGTVYQLVSLNGESWVSGPPQFWKTAEEIADDLNTLKAKVDQ